MMLTFGCLTLMANGLLACFSGDVQGNVKLTCSDAIIQGLPTCKEQMAKAGTGTASTGSFSTLTTITVPDQR